jgi:hypothetical protein
MPFGFPEQKVSNSHAGRSGFVVCGIHTKNSSTGLYPKSEDASLACMHGFTAPVHRKRLLDPAACGVRLGVELRAAAEREAYRVGMCLSVWIRGLVESALREAKSSPHPSEPDLRRESQIDSTDFKPTKLDAAFAEEMGKLPK